VANAIKYGAAGAPVTIRAFGDDNGATISVHNLGNPIPIDEQGPVFETFHRAPSTDGEHEPGWGLERRSV
jgi:signal transduction histidine kinase